MASTITLPQLIELLAQNNHSADLKQLEKTANAFFAAITEALKTEKVVKINNFGSFAINEIDGNCLSFIPCEDIAKTINAPFEFFEPVELGENVTDTMLAEADKPVLPEEKQDGAAETAVEHETDVNEQPKQDEEPETTEAIITENNTTEETEPENERLNQLENIHENTVNEKIIYIYKRVFPWWYALIGGTAMGIVAGLFLLYIFSDDISNKFISNSQNENDIEEITPVECNEEILPLTESQTTEEPDHATDAKATINDTITSTRFLTTMARQYYGEMAFWAYIYIENSEKLGNPDRIAPNTTVVIPPAEKYNIDKNNPESVNDAKQKGAEIYSKYKK